ncbi:MAG: hypothetical protein ACE5JU_21770 [Candidatus Binatia bacterium]
MNFKEHQPRRRFLAGFMAGLAGAAAFLLAPKRARAATKKSAVPATGPILYHRTEEAERYYRTLYR